MTRDQRPGQRGDERVATHVERIGLQRRQAVALGVLRAGVDNHGFDRAAVERTLPDDLEVLTALADVRGDRHDLRLRLLRAPPPAAPPPIPAFVPPASQPIATDVSSPPE